LVIGASLRVYAVTFFLGVSPAYQPTPVAQLPELRELELVGWDCLQKPEGAAKTEEGKERNRQKNRKPERTDNVMASVDTAAFLARITEYDRQIQKKRRRELSPQQKEQLFAFENQMFSVTGWLVLAYQSPIPESANCRSHEFSDWHLELSAKPADHPVQVGDPTPIVCEITPRTEVLLHMSGVRIQKLAAFLRLPDNSFSATGSKPHKIRVTGYLMWDDEHNKTDTDVGSFIGWFSKEGYHHPWRSTAWEIHPVMKIDDLGTE
jgi:hypothetical protein